MEKLLKSVTFEDECINVNEDIKKFNTPVILRVKGQCLLSEQWTLNDGSVIVIHERKNVGILKGKDSSGRDITLFTPCQQTVQLALPESERKNFTSLNELCLQETRPKFVEIAFDDKDDVNDSVKSGDRLKILLVEKGPKGPLFMHFRNEKGKHIRLPVDIKASFTACPPDGKEYFISEIANINKAPLALFITFIKKSSDKSSIFTSLGTIEIVGQNSADVIYMTVKDNGKLYCCACPVPEDLCGQVGKGATEKSDEYEKLRARISELAPVENFENLHGDYNPLGSEDFLVFPNGKVFLKKKSKEKDKRIESLIVENEEESTEKKRNSLIALFKDEKRKEVENANKKEKNKKKNKKNKEGQQDSASREESEAETVGDKVAAENGNSRMETSKMLDTEKSKDNMQAIGIQGSDSKGDQLFSKDNKSEEKKKKKTADDKKKWKFDLKSKFTANEKKDKKKKGQIGKGDSIDNPQIPSQTNVESSSEPCSPGSDIGNDDYEEPEELQGIAAQNKCPDTATHRDKGKSSTLISRTWKKMKKRRRALSASNMQRSHGAAGAVNIEAGGSNDETPPPILDADYPDELYEQIPGEFVSQDIYEEAVRAYGSYEAAGVPTAEVSDCGFDECDKEQLDALRNLKMPPPLPGNHPSMQPRPRRGSSLTGENSRFSVDSEGFRRFYESMKRSESQIRSWGPDEIEKSLNDLQLGHHADKFNESQIDGSLLYDLDEAVLRDLGLSLFEARKLRKFVFGWRPDSLRDSLYRQKYNRESKNPSYWSTIMVADMITIELGIPDFGTFCKENQVNGDLLRDVVIDDELLSFLLSGKASKLNAVKIKNFVLDGWRPPKKKESQYEAVDLQNLATSIDTSYEPLSPTIKEAKNTYEALSPRRNTTGAESEKQSYSARKVIEKEDKINTVLDTTKDKTISHQTSREKTRVTSSSGSVNSLMHKYEKKSTNIDAPRPFTKAGSPRSPGFLGNENRGEPTSPLVANMKKKFSEK